MFPWRNQIPFENSLFESVSAIGSVLRQSPQCLPPLDGDAVSCTFHLELLQSPVLLSHFLDLWVTLALPLTLPFFLFCLNHSAICILKPPLGFSVWSSFLHAWHLLLPWLLWTFFRTLSGQDVCLELPISRPEAPSSSQYKPYLAFYSLFLLFKIFNMTIAAQNPSWKEMGSLETWYIHTYIFILQLLKIFSVNFYIRSVPYISPE